MKQNKKRKITTTSRIRRSDFIIIKGVSSAGINAAAFFTQCAWGYKSSNDTIWHAVIENGNQGGDHCRRFTTTEGCKLVVDYYTDPRFRQNIQRSRINKKSN
jgi:hypothetical protein